MTDDMRPRFWERFALEDLTRAEWEALCDGCAKCCLIKLEDEDTGEVSYTNISCRLLDQGTCRCSNYPLRRQLVRDCNVLDMATLERIADWLPLSCAYRRMQDGAGWRHGIRWFRATPRVSTRPASRCAGRWSRNTISTKTTGPTT